MKQATIKDIARLSGCSASTVSRALKGHPDISMATREKIQSVADALGYMPHPTAQALRTRSSRLIALVLPKLDSFFFPQLLAAVSEAVERRGYSLLFLQTDNVFSREEELLAYCLRMRVEGVLLSLSRGARTIAHLEALKRKEVPVVLFDHILDDVDLPATTIDDEEVAYTAVNYLLEHGHRRILGVFDHPVLHMTRHRRAGYEQAYQAHGLEVPEELILEIDDDGDSLQLQLRDFVSTHPEATALFAMSDKLMVRAYHVINQLGLDIPKEMSLLSISDGKAPYYLFPNITHMRHSGDVVGRQATDLLFSYLEDPGQPPRFEAVDVELVELGSVRDIRQPG